MFLKEMVKVLSKLSLNLRLQGSPIVLLTLWNTNVNLMEDKLNKVLPCYVWGHFKTKQFSKVWQNFLKNISLHRFEKIFNKKWEELTCFNKLDLLRSWYWNKKYTWNKLVSLLFTCYNEVKINQVRCCARCSLDKL